MRLRVNAVAVTCAGASACGAGRGALVVALARALARVKRARSALSKYVILWLSRVTEKENGAVVLLSSSVCLSTPKLRVTAEG